MFFQECSIALPSLDGENVGDALELWKLTKQQLVLVDQVEVPCQRVDDGHGHKGDQEGTK